MDRVLVRDGAGLRGLVQAGRWGSPAVPARYARGELAGQGAVACYYKMPQISPAQSATTTANRMNDHPADIAGTGASGGPTVVDVALQFVGERQLEVDAQRCRLDGGPPQRAPASLRVRARSGLQAVAEKVVPKRRRLRKVRTAFEAGPERPAVVIRHDSERFAEQTEHQSRIQARRVAVATGLGLEATARRRARNYELAYGRPVAVPRRAGRVALPSGRPGGRRLPVGRVGRPSGRVQARRQPATSRGTRASPGRAGSGDPDLPPEPLAVVARPGRAASSWPRLGVGFPEGCRSRGHVRRQDRGVAWAGCRVRVVDLDRGSGDGLGFTGHRQQGGRRRFAAGPAAQRCPCLLGRRRDRRGRRARRGDALGSASTHVNEAAGCTGYQDAVTACRKRLGETKRSYREGVRV